jgi:stage III sporulation protein AA
MIREAIALDTKPFEEAAANLPGFVRDALRVVPDCAKAETREIRLRAGSPIVLTLPDGVQYLTGARLSSVYAESYPRLTAQDMQEIFKAICGYSVHSFTETARLGYIPLAGGHRAGVCGSAVVEGEKVQAVRTVSSVNLRIARDIPGSANSLTAGLYQGKQLPNLLVLGIPGSGKTTVLRDLTRQISQSGRRVAVIDERGEFAGTRDGSPCRQVGINTDILNGYPKAEGILLAVRSLAPEVIVCDELGDAPDAAALEAGANAGVAFAASAHAGSFAQARARPVVRRLLDAGVFTHIARLEGPQSPGRVAEMMAIEG